MRHQLSRMFALSFASLFVAAAAFGHCDTMDGPVVKAAQKALTTGNVNLVLIWVQPKDEAIIRDAFARTLTVRKLDPRAQSLADLWFFETLVRVHRAGEGVAYTGLKPAGTPVEPGIEAAEHALEAASVEELAKHATQAVHHGLQERFEKAISRLKAASADNVESGRAYVQAYVEFIHYAERLLQAAEPPAGGHLHHED